MALSLPNLLSERALTGERVTGHQPSAQRRQMRLLLAVAGARVHPPGGPALPRRGQPLPRMPPAHPLDGPLTDVQGEPERAREKYRAALAICARLGEGLYHPHIERALAE